MQEREVARRYAKAFFQACTDAKVDWERFHQDISCVESLFASKDLRKVFETPLLSLEQKHGLIKKLIESLKLNYPNLWRQFFSLVLSRKRTKDLSAMLQDLRARVYADQGKIPVHVKSAFALSEADRNRVMADLKKWLGKEPVLEVEVDSNLLAGLSARAGDKILDNSLKTQLQHLRTRLTYDN